MRQGLVLNDAGDIIGLVTVSNDDDINRQAHDNFVTVPSDHVITQGPNGLLVNPIEGDEDVERSAS